MSYKDLENEIARWADLEAFAAARKKEVEDRKAFKKRKNARPPMFKPDKPVVYHIEVTLNVRRYIEGVLSDLDQASFVVETISETEAELQAKQQAKASGFLWRGTVSVKQKKGK